MKIPEHLTHLRRDRRGLPVPYVNRWGPERTETLRIRYDSTVGAQAVFQDDQHETEPDFTAQNMGRQRECMLLGLCQVCARALPWPDRHLVVASMSIETIEMDGRGHVVVTEPWLCSPCLDVAVDHCPALIRRRRNEQLTIVQPTTNNVRFVTSTGWIEGPLARQSRKINPTLWAKAVLHSAIPTTVTLTGSGAPT